MEANRELQIIESNTLSMLLINVLGMVRLSPLMRAMTMVSEALDTLTSISAMARLQMKKYMGE